MKAFLYLVAGGTLFAQSALLENWATARTAIGSSTPMWGVYTGGGGGGNPCSTQSWSVTGGFGIDTAGSNSCPYMNAQIGAQGGTPTGYYYPTGYIQSYILSGSWSPTFNRFTFSMNCGASWPLQATTASMGTYVRDPTATDAIDQGQHYYHLMANAVNAGSTYYFTMNMHPQHRVGVPSQINWPNDPEWVFSSQTARIHYYDGLTRFYINPYFVALPGGVTCKYGPMSFQTESNEPDEEVSTIAGSYDGTAYHVDWAGPKNINVTYSVNFAAASMHANGFSSGTSCGPSPSTSGSTYTNVNWTCVMGQVPKLYVAIRPTSSILGTTGRGVSPILVSTAADMGMSNGDGVQVAGVNGNTAANGTFSVTPIARSFFTMSAGTLTNIVQSNGVVTVTTASPHGLIAGQYFEIWELDGAGPNAFAYYGPAQIQSVPTPTTFTLSISTASLPNGTYTNSSIVSWSDPALSLSGSIGNGAYTSGGTIVPTSNTTNFTEVEIDGSTPLSACDLNQDGVVNILDVTLMINQSLGTIACTNRLDGGTSCDVIDIQRVVNASLGGACITN